MFMITLVNNFIRHRGRQSTNKNKKRETGQSYDIIKEQQIKTTQLNCGDVVDRSF